MMKVETGERRHLRSSYRYSSRKMLSSTQARISRARTWSQATSSFGGAISTDGSASVWSWMVKPRLTKICSLRASHRTRLAKFLLVTLIARWSFEKTVLEIILSRASGGQLVHVRLWESSADPREEDDEGCLAAVLNTGGRVDGARLNKVVNDVWVEDAPDRWLAGEN